MQDDKNMIKACNMIKMTKIVCSLGRNLKKQRINACAPITTQIVAGRFIYEGLDRCEIWPSKMDVGLKFMPKTVDIATFF